MKKIVRLIGGPKGDRDYEIDGNPVEIVVPYRDQNSSKVVLPLPTALYRRSGRRGVYRFVEMK